MGTTARAIERMPPAEEPTPALLRHMRTLRTSMKQVLDHFAALGFSPATVLDVGVAYGTPALYSTFRHAHHVLIEPLVEFEDSMKDICGRYDAEYVLGAASAKPGKLKIAIASDLVGSSLLAAEGGENVVWREVPAVTLDGICQERGLKGPYVVKVDVQGAELHVLDGAKTVLEDTEAVILEVSFFQFDGSFPEFYEVIRYMKERGFVAYDIFGGHNRPLDGARAQADVAFVKEDGRFRASHAWATSEQRAEFYSLTKR
jgi:FkbM family methyltransferase